MPASRRSQPAVSLDARAKIPDGILSKELAGETVLLNLHTGAYFGLDPIGTRIWQLLQAHVSLAAVLQEILNEFDVEESQGRADLLQLVSTLCSHGLLQLVPAVEAPARA